MDLDEVKLCIRSLMSSNSMPFNLSSLMMDFRNITGMNLPLFGYPNPVEFLSSLSDTVKLQGDPNNPEVILLESSKSAHIISLVNRQRIHSRTRARYQLDKMRPRRQICTVRSIDNPEQESHSGWNEPPQRCMAQELEETHWRIKKPVQNAAVTSEASEGAQAVGDVQVSEGAQTSGGDQASQSSQAAEGALASGFTPQSCQKRENRETSWSENSPPLPDQNSSFLSLSFQNYIQNPSTSNETTSMAAQNKEQSKNKRPAKERVDKIKTEGHSFEDKSCHTRSVKSRLGTASRERLNDEFKDKLKSLMKNYPRGLWCCDLPEAFREMYHHSLDYQLYGYSCFGDMLTELTDVFRCERPNREDWLLFDASHPPTEEEKQVLEFHLKKERLKGIRSNLIKIVSKRYGNTNLVGVYLDKIQEVYKRMFGVPLDNQAFGYSSLRSLLGIWEGTELNIVDVKGRLFCTPAFGKPSNTPVLWKEAVPPVTPDSDLFRQIFPEDVIGPDDTLQELNLRYHIAVSMVMDVAVGEVWTPHKFFIQFNKFKKRLDGLMDDLQKFYKENANKYVMSDTTIQPNQLCAGPYNFDCEFPDEWHRIRIIGNPEGKYVNVSFVDFGTESQMRKSELRYLHRNFRFLPVMAYPAKLAGVLPPEGETEWPMSTNRKFLEMLRVPSLKAEIVDIDFEKPLITVILYDPTQVSGVRVSDILIQQNLARADESVTRDVDMWIGRDVDWSSEEDETRGHSECSSSTLIEANEASEVNEENEVNEVNERKETDGAKKTNETLNKNVPEIRDEFLDFDDLKPSTSFPFRMKNLSPDPWVSNEREEGRKGADSEVIFEFESIPPLEGEEKNAEKLPQGNWKETDEGHVADVPSVEPALPEPHAEQMSPDTPEVTLPVLPYADILIPKFSSLSIKTKRIPSGVEHVTMSSDFSGMPFVQDWKKSLNLLAIEYMATNENIKTVGAFDPALALRIATDMAEAYMTSQMSYGFHPLFPQISADEPIASTSSAPPQFIVMDRPGTSSQTALLPYTAPQRVPTVPEETEEKQEGATALSHEENAPGTSSPKLEQGPENVSEESDNRIEKIVIGGRSIHFIEINRQLYFAAEELVREFTTFKSWYLAEQLLEREEYKPDYKVINKKSHKNIFKILKSELPEAGKGKSRVLNIHLLPFESLIEFMVNLECWSEENEKTIQMFLLMRQEKKVQID